MSVMYIFNVFNYYTVKDTVGEYLKSKGVKYKVPKKHKEVLPCTIKVGVFQSPLADLAKIGVPIKGGAVMIEVPKFLEEACRAIEQNIHVEGIFRKAGSANKQRELKQLINSGMPLPESCHVVDACNLVKLFLRELPEPLIPYCLHETLLSCLLLSGEEAQREMLLLSCLLIYKENLAVLAYVLEFLSKVCQHATSNKMDAKNLAIVLTPSLMPIDKNKMRSNFSITHHIAVVELLIRSAADVGAVPQYLAEQALAHRNRKRRSASITRMFTGIRKMVGRNPSPSREASPALEDTGQKRKSVEILPPAVEVKRRREVADTTPRMCRMGGYSGASLPKSNELNSTELKPSDSPLTNKNDEAIKRTVVRKGGRKQGLKASKSTSSLLMCKKRAIEKKLNGMSWGKRRSNTKIEASCNENSEVVTIPRQQYEDILTRVTCMEKLLQDQRESKSEVDSESLQLADKLGKDLVISWSTQNHFNPNDSANAVQAAFERTVEQAEQLAPQLPQDVRLRWSSERRVARSPSQRKIGSIRRRSRELGRSNSADAKTSLQRGRPNTRRVGLRSPRELSEPKRSPRRTGNGSVALEEWQPAKTVFASPALASRLLGSPQKRDSITSLRRNNLGMVYAKAKFFDSLNHSTDTESDRTNQSMERRLLAVQAELQQQIGNHKETRQPVIKAALCVPNQQLKTPRSVARSALRPRATPLKALPENVNTPLRGVRRSPRILSRTMSLHVSNSTRTP